MPTPLTAEQAAALGVTALHERMDNGECRFRLRHTDGSAYIRTEAGADSGWQNSHLHAVTFELNVIQSGAMLLVEEEDGGVHTWVLRAGDSFCSRPNVPHNSYLLPGTVAHTVKMSCPPQGDWVACPHLDPICRAMDVNQIFNP